MKVKASLKLACADCYYVRRGKYLYIRCMANPRHKRRQGFSTLNYLPHTPISMSPATIDNFQQGDQHEHQPNCYYCNKKVALPMQLHRVIEVQQAYAKFEAELEAENKK